MCGRISKTNLGKAKPYSSVAVGKIRSDDEQCHLSPRLVISSNERLVVIYHIPKHFPVETRVIEGSHSSQDLLLLLTTKSLHTSLEKVLVRPKRMVCRVSTGVALLIKIKIMNSSEVTIPAPVGTHWKRSTDNENIGLGDSVIPYNVLHRALCASVDRLRMCSI